MPVPVYLTNRLLARYPLSEHLPYRTYDEERQLFGLQDGRLGAVWSCDPIAGLSDAFMAKLTNLFELDLPPGSTIQMSFHASPVVEAWLEAYEALRRQASPTLQQLARRVADFFRQRQARLIPSLNLPLRDCTCYISVTIPLAGEHKHGLRLKDLADAVAGIEQLLLSCGLGVTRLNPTQLLQLLHTLLNPSHPRDQAPTTYNPLIPLAEQAIRYDTVTRLTPRWIELDGQYVKSLSIQQFPEQWHGSRNRDLIGGLIRYLDQITAPFWLTLNTVRLDYQQTQSLIRKKHLLLTNQSYGSLLNVVPILRRKKEHFDAIMNALTDGRQPIGAYMHMLVWCPTVEAAERQTQTIRALYRSLDWLVQEDHYVGLPLLLNALPMGLSNDVPLLRDKLRRLKTLHTGCVPHLAPLAGDWKGLGRMVVPLVGRSGQIMRFDPFANPSGNYSICVAAQSGSGKSFFANELIRSYLGLGGRVWMIDAGKSYIKLCEQVDGQYIQFTKHGHQLCLNPFHYVVERDEDEIAMLKAIFAQMASPSRPLTDLELSWMEQAITQALAEHGTAATPTDVANLLLRSGDRRQHDLGTMLFPYTVDGSHGRLFHQDPTAGEDRTIRFDKSFVILELDGLDTMLELRSVVLLQLLFAIQSAMYSGSRGQPKICAMDEAWDLLSQGGNVAAFFEKAVRRVRKYGGAILTITQGINDYYDKMGLTGAALIENSDFVVLLRQKPESLETIRQRGRLQLSDYEYQLLNTIHLSKNEYSELFLYTPVGRGIARLVTDRYTQLYFTTNPEELSRIAAYTAQGLSTEEAICAVLRDEEAAQGANGHATS
jgi:conjugal transfer ATP-binding protein TraC